MAELPATGADLTRICKALRSAYGYENCSFSCPQTGITLLPKSLRAALIFPDDLDAVIEVLEGRLNRVDCACGNQHVLLVPVVAIDKATNEVVCVTAGAPAADMRASLVKINALLGNAVLVPDYNGLLAKLFTWIDTQLFPLTVEVLAGRLKTRTRTERIAMRHPVCLVALREAAEGRLPVRITSRGDRALTPKESLELVSGLHQEIVSDQLQDLFGEYGSRRLAGEAAKRVPAAALNPKILAHLATYAAERLRPLLQSPGVPDDAATAVDASTFAQQVAAAYTAGLINAVAHMIAGAKNPGGQGFGAVVRALWRKLGSADVDAILPDKESAARLVSFEAIWDASAREMNATSGTPALRALLDDLTAMFKRLGMESRFESVLRKGVFRSRTPPGTEAATANDDWDDETASRYVSALRASLVSRRRLNISVDESLQFGVEASALLTNMFADGRSNAAEHWIDSILEEALDAHDFVAAYSFGDGALAICGRAEAFELALKIAGRLIDLFMRDDVSEQLARAGAGLTVSFCNECGNAMRHVGHADQAIESYRIARGFLSLIKDAVDRERREAVLSRNEGRALRDLGRFAEALPLLARDVDKHLDDVAELQGLAVLYVRVGRFADAVALLDQAVGFSDPRVDAMERTRSLILRAEARRGLGDNDGVVADLEEAMRTAPVDAEGTRARIAESAARVPKLGEHAPVLALVAEDLLRASLVSPAPSTHRFQHPSAIASLGMLLLQQDNADNCEAFERDVLDPYLGTEDALIDWRLLRLKGLLDRRRHRHWTREGWDWMAAAAESLDNQVPTGDNTEFAAGWLADKESFQTDLLEAGVAVVDEGGVRASALWAVYDLANGRELSAALDSTPSSGEMETAIETRLAEAAAEIGRPIVVFAFLDTGRSIRVMTVSSGSGRSGLLLGAAWEADCVATAAAAFTRAIEAINPAAPDSIARRIGPWLDLLASLGEAIGPCLVSDALVCFLPGRRLTSLPLHLMKLPDGRGELLLSHPVLYAPNFAILLERGAKARRAERSGRARLLVSVTKERDGYAFRSRQALAARALTRRFGGMQFVKRLSGKRATPEAVLRALAEADEVLLLCHGAHIGRYRGYGLYLSDGRDLPPAVSVDVDIAPEVRRFTLAWDAFAGVAMSPAVIVSLACSSARTVVARAGVRVGPDAAAFAKGTRAIVAPLWNVDQDASLAWVDAFEAARSQASRKTVALWDAHREASLRAREKFNHFFFWSALVLLGPIYGGISHEK
jgi:tetratricopeptide (TPR) repeat protein